MNFLRLLFLVLSAAISLAQSPLPRAHAHNDYEHARPLLDALDQGFRSVEADIYLVNGELLVAHDAKDVRPDRTLEKLYLDPLKERVAREKDFQLSLLIDIKSEALATYQTLEKKIEPYRNMLTLFEGDEIKTNAITIILSGNRPRDYLAGQPRRWVAMDGRLPDLTNNSPRTLIPLVSDNWTSHFKWRTGDFSADESSRLKEIIGKAHAQGRMVRFWAVPDNQEAWGLLYEAGVDLINTDRLAELAAFLKTKK